MSSVIQIDESRIREHFGEMVPATVEEALNAMFGAKADRLCGAARYEPNESRQDTRVGSYNRSLRKKAGEVNLMVPKLQRQIFERAVFERYQRGKSSMEIALKGRRVAPGTASELKKRSTPRLSNSATGGSIASIRTCTCTAL